MSFFISDAMAAVGNQPGQADSTMSLLMIVGIFVLFYFMLIRPQTKRAKEHRQLVGALKAGDEVVTSGGILGKVNTLDDNYVKITIADGVEINLQRNAIHAVLPKGTLKAL